MDKNDNWLNEPPAGTRPADLAFLALKDTFLAGDASGERLRLRYYHDCDQRVLIARVLFGVKAQGPPDHVHGGAQASLLDETMGGIAWLSGYPVVAAQLNTTFRAMLPLTIRAEVHAEVKQVEGRKVWTRGDIRDGNSGKVFTRAEALFVKLDEDHIARLSDKAQLIIEAMRHNGL